jgi:mRNA-degrading endonuclease RelE of RelBE toxin-antitoxin system
MTESNAATIVIPAYAPTKRHPREGGDPVFLRMYRVGSLLDNISFMGIFFRMDMEKTAWQVGMTKKAAKGRDNLPPEILDLFWALLQGLMLLGPVQAKWSHYGKLTRRKETYHCHLHRGRPTYVVIWKVLDRAKKLMEVQYVGTHENAPY